MISIFVMVYELFSLLFCCNNNTIAKGLKIFAKQKKKQKKRAEQENKKKRSGFHIFGMNAAPAHHMHHKRMIQTKIKRTNTTTTKLNAITKKRM